MTWVAALGGFPVFLDPAVQLEDAKGERVLCVRIDGRILVHPSMWDAFVDALARGATPRLARVH